MALNLQKSRPKEIGITVHVYGHCAQVRLADNSMIKWLSTGRNLTRAWKALFRFFLASCCDENSFLPGTGWHTYHMKVLRKAGREEVRD